MPDGTCMVCGRIIPEGRHICLSCEGQNEMQRFTADKPLTNGDRIRASTDNELTRFLGCKCCAYLAEPKCDNLNCTEGKLQWLGSEVRSE